MKPRSPEDKVLEKKLVDALLELPTVVFANVEKFSPIMAGANLRPDSMKAGSEPGKLDKSFKKMSE